MATMETLGVRRLASRSIIFILILGIFKGYNNYDNGGYGGFGGGQSEC